jgi:hypothetical protein
MTAIARAPAAPRELFCAIEHLHRDRAVADAVRKGCFTHAGITCDLGTEPDWLGAPLPADEEWRIEWVKFYYGLDLSFAFRETGDHAYLYAWERLVRSWIRQVPAHADSSDITARRITNWLYAWGSFAAASRSSEIADSFAEELVASIASQAAHVRANLTPARNHRTLELYSLFLAALALPELDPDGNLLAFAVTELHKDLLTAFRPDGVHREGSTHYHMVVLRTFLGVRENARRHGITLPDGYDDGVARACEFALHAHRPDGRIAALSDSDGGDYRQLLALAGRLLGRDDLHWAATGGREGRPPTVRNASFPDGGYFFQRSGWGEHGARFADERFLVFDCGPLGDGGHGHYDLLSIEIAARGRPLIVDPGRYTYSEQGSNLRRWFKSTTAHNTVVVDGLDQTPYRRGKPKGSVARGRLLGRSAENGVDVIAGRVTSPLYEAVHDRRIVFVGGEYWLIEDDLRGDRPHRYDLRFHLAPEAHGRCGILGNAVRAPGVALVFSSPGVPRLEEGWVSTLYGRKDPAPVVSVEVDDVAEATFVTLVAPLEDGLPAPELFVDEERVLVVGERCTDVISRSGESVGWERR